MWLFCAVEMHSTLSSRGASVLILMRASRDSWWSTSFCTEPDIRLVLRLPFRRRARRESLKAILTIWILVDWLLSQFLIVSYRIYYLHLKRLSFSASRCMCHMSPICYVATAHTCFWTMKCFRLWVYLITVAIWIWRPVLHRSSLLEQWLSILVFFGGELKGNDFC